MKIKPIILSGGSGTRLWPLSRENKPKQFFDIFNEKTNLFEETLNRINNPKEMLKLVKTLQPHYCLVTGIENSHIGNFRNFRHLVDNKLNVFKSKRLISGLVNYNYNTNFINNKLNRKL